MLKVERKLIEFLEKHMILLAALLLSGIAFLLRRQNIWFHTEDYIYYFDRHQNHIQTPLYFLLVKLTGYGFDLPLHGMKWIAGMADFAVALGAVWYCRKSHSPIRLLLLYAACLFAPVVYLRGCVEARIDSAAFLFLLAGACFLKRSEGWTPAAAVISAAVGAAFYPPLLIIIIWYCMTAKQERREVKYLWLPVLGIVILLELLSGFCVDFSAGESMASLWRWTTHQPYTGAVYRAPAEWLSWQLMLFAHGFSVIGLIAASEKKLSGTAAVILQLLLAVWIVTVS